MATLALGLKLITASGGLLCLYTALSNIFSGLDYISTLVCFYLT